MNNDEEIMIQNQYRTILRWTTSTTTRSASTRKRSSSLKKMTRSRQCLPISTNSSARQQRLQECTARYNVLRKMMTVIGPAHISYFQCQTTDEDGTTAMLRLLCIHGKVVSVPAYINYFQNQSTEDTRPITRYYVLRNTKDTKSVVLIYGSENKIVKKQNDVTQAGSD